MRRAIVIVVLAVAFQGHAKDLETRSALAGSLVEKFLNKLCDLASQGWPRRTLDLKGSMPAGNLGPSAYVQFPSTGRPANGRSRSTALATKRHVRPSHALERPIPSVARTSCNTMSGAQQASTRPTATLRTNLDYVWYTLYHAWRAWYFTSLFMLAFMSANRFSPAVVLGLLVGHPGFYLTFFAIAKSVYDVDWRCIENGIYKMPYDADVGSAFQWMRPDKIIAYCKDVSAIAARAARDGYNELPATYRKPPSDSYPDYYLRNFHYQTDGWLSDASAFVYETATEALFSGTQDAMQRMGLIAIKCWLEDRTDPAPVELLEAGCGTGRLLCQIAHNFESFHLTALDLSPYYLDVCRQSYSELQASSSKLRPAEFINANMEKLPFPDASKDIVVCAYVFHELPPFARQQVVREFFRVLKPGGLCVLLDSVQDGDLGPDMSGTLQWFPRTFHEPYYMSWLDLDLDRLFEGSGFKSFGASQRHVSKMEAWVKPAQRF